MIHLKLPKENKKELIERIQAYFYEERAEEIGELAAGFLLDFMIKEIGPVIYNQAINDARKLIEEKMLSIEEDLHVMEKPTTFLRR